MKKKNECWVLIALALSGASALIYEVVATNILFFYFVESSYSIATVLGTFLLGLGVGSFAIYKMNRKIKNKKNLFGVLQIIIGVYSYAVLANLQSVVPKLHTLGVLLASFLILLIPSVFLGAMFPLASSLYGKNRRDVSGLIYSYDLFGAILGAALAGFLLIPTFGNSISVVFGVGLNLLSAIIVFSNFKKVIPVVLLILLLAVVIIAPGNLVSAEEGVEFVAYSAFGEVKIVEGELIIDGREQCGFGYPEDASERKIAEYALSHFEIERPLEVLNIGLGCGLTSESALEFESNLDIVEINPEVVRANSEYSGVLDHPRANLINDEGLNYLRNSEKKYDSIIIDIENPQVAHSTDLYTVDAFEIIGDSLKEDGSFALWAYGTGEHKYLGLIFYSLKEVFPYVYYKKDVFIASKVELEGEEEYNPIVPYAINTIDKNIANKYFTLRNGK